MNTTRTSPAPLRVAVVTGAGGGLGRAFSTALARDGWTVAALGRTLSSLSATVTDCLAASADNRTPQPHSAVVCDVTDASSVTEAFRTVTERYDRLDLLVNNAGIPGPTGRIDTVHPSEVEQTFRTNSLGTLLCTQAAFTWMAAHGGGRIINNGSIAAHAPRAGAAAYAASKAAVASLTISTALDGREYGISATQLDIGNARTELLETFSSTEPMFDAAEAAHLLVTVAALPAGVSVDAVRVTAAGMPYLGRG
ncbi:SDR family oxidoreductase [Corynebacterium terpenotabidum]|uniref:Short-chain dehydrogenase/reductase n=1 Tax=Corynebacterium terpenotabidum Y-11 TaxID=1200352 RepID=S4XHB3_9CORY|nr:SDR family NAD(P)-dependent oxidoreductase [Corynebacterium terpenotabidum]AGP31065.1 short-chain dehydrogenase/reductase [Corynebacterium terpenotabidum Y-11]